MRHALLCTGKAEIIEIRKGGNTLQASVVRSHAEAIAKAGV